MSFVFLRFHSAALASQEAVDSFDEVDGFVKCACVASERAQGDSGWVKSDCILSRKTKRQYVQNE